MLEVLGVIGIVVAVLFLLAVVVGLPVLALVMAIRHDDSVEAGRRVRALGKHYDPYTHRWRLNNRKGSATSTPTAGERSQARQRPGP